jgi:hypothetical protein
MDETFDTRNFGGSTFYAVFEREKGVDFGSAIRRGLFLSK